MSRDEPENPHLPSLDIITVNWNSGDQLRRCLASIPAHPAGYTIDRVVVYTLGDSYGAPVEPGDSQTFSLFGILDFTVQVWNGSTWSTVATITGNNLVKRTITFAAVSTDRVRVTVTNALFGYSRIVELEAWTP